MTLRSQPDLRKATLLVSFLWAVGCVSGVSNDFSEEDDPNNPNPGSGGTKTGSGGSKSSGSGGTTSSSGGTENPGSGGTENPGSGGTTQGSGGTGGGTQVACSKSKLDDFESAGSAWFAWKDAGDPGKLTMKREAGGHEGMGLHSVFSNIKAAMGSIQLNLSALPKSKACPDYAATTGLRFWAKGSEQIRVAALIAPILPKENGGTCTDPEACWSNHGYDLELTSDWKEYKIPWGEFTQKNPVKATDFDKMQIKQITFTNLKDGSAELWLDDLNFESTAIDGPNDKGEPTCTVAKYLSESDFNAWFPQRNGLYSYNSGLCEAIKRYWNKFSYKFANSGNADADKREIAAFFAHVKKETVGLQYTTEVNPTAPPYHGRGPLQLTHVNNYRAAGTMMGVDLENNPDILASDPVVTWGASLWFWITERGAGSMTCHDAMTEGQGQFVETLRTINGALEGCSGSHAQERANYYSDFCGRLGVSTGGPMTC